jgi:hypothetical protein
MAYQGKVDWRYRPYQTVTRTRLTGAALSLMILGATFAAEMSPQARPQPSRRTEGYYKGQITPHWFGDNTQFWYRNDLSGGAREFILVNAERGTREPAFDHARLAAALSQAAGSEYEADRLPFDVIEFPDDGNVVRFLVDQTTWDCDLKSYTCVKSSVAMEPPARDRDQESTPFGRRRGAGPAGGPSSDSPDGKWTAFTRDHNVFLRCREGDEEIQLSTDGVEGNAYGRFSWSPDSRTLVAYRIEPGDRHEVHLIQSSPAGGGRARLSSRPYSLPGDKFTMYELNLFDVERPQADQARRGPARARLADPAPAVEKGPAAFHL